MSDRETATRLLRELVDRDRRGLLTPMVAVELAKHLAHIAGGDGRGIYEVVHRAGADRVVDPPLLEQEVWTTPDDDEDPEDFTSELLCTVRVLPDGLQLTRQGMLLYSAAWRYWALSMLYTRPPSWDIEQQLPDPGQKLVRTTFADGKRDFEIRPDGR